MAFFQPDASEWMPLYVWWSWADWSDATLMPALDYDLNAIIVVPFDVRLGTLQGASASIRLVALDLQSVPREPVLQGPPSI